MDTTFTTTEAAQGWLDEVAADAGAQRQSIARLTDELRQAEYQLGVAVDEMAELSASHRHGDLRVECPSCGARAALPSPGFVRRNFGEYLWQCGEC